MACSQRVTTRRPFGRQSAKPVGEGRAGKGVGLAEAEGAGGDALEGLAEWPDHKVVAGGGPQGRADAVTQDTDVAVVQDGGVA